MPAALLGGSAVGTLMQGHYDFTDNVMMPNLAKKVTPALLLLFMDTGGLTRNMSKQVQLKLLKALIIV